MEKGLTPRITLTGLENWRQIYFGSIANSGNGADLSDTDRDGIGNLLEFDFGLNPTQNSAGQLPRPQKVGGNFVASFTQPAGVSGITYGAEWSTTLLNGSWTPIPDTGAGSTHTFSISIGTVAEGDEPVERVWRQPTGYLRAPKKASRLSPCSLSAPQSSSTATRPLRSHARMKTPSLSLLLAFTLFSTSAHAWDQKGHRVVAAVAWDHMDASTRTKAVGLLRGGAGGCGFAGGGCGVCADAGAAGSGAFPAGGDLAGCCAGLRPCGAARPFTVRRYSPPPPRRAKYHHSPWHYVNMLWQERGRKPVERKAVRSLSSWNRPESERRSM